VFAQFNEVISFIGVNWLGETLIARNINGKWVVLDLDNQGIPGAALEAAARPLAGIREDSRQRIQGLYRSKRIKQIMVD
jgi:hypothetical protein